MNQKKKPQLTKEMKAENKRQRAFVKEVVWPFLVANSKHINDAKNILEASVVGIQQAYDTAMLEEQKKWSNTKLGEFDINKTVLKRAEYKTEHKLISLFEDETLATGKGLLQGMKNVIDSFIKEEMQGRKLDTLKTDFLD